jgi:hypothetical protein
MPNDREIFDASYVTPAGKTTSTSKSSPSADLANAEIQVESDKYKKGKPYRVILRGRLISNQLGELDG